MPAPSPKPCRTGLASRSPWTIGLAPEAISAPRRSLTQRRTATILFGTNGTLGIGPALYKNLRYDPLHDLAPVGLLHKLPLLLIVNPSVPAKDLQELIDYARSNPGKLSFASAGVGSVSHLAGELFKEEAKIDILHVPYKGGGAAVTDLISGRVSMMLETIPNALPLARSGQMRAIAVTTKERSSSAPEIPTMAGSACPIST